MLLQRAGRDKGRGSVTRMGEARECCQQNGCNRKLHGEEDVEGSGVVCCEKSRDGSDRCVHHRQC